jgi:hypothetical protein
MTREKTMSHELSLENLKAISLTDFFDALPEYTTEMRKTGRPMALTRAGEQRELVVWEIESFLTLLERIDPASAADWRRQLQEWEQSHAQEE